MVNPADEMEIKYLRIAAEELGLTLQEYLLLEVLHRLENLSVTTYPGE